MLAYTTLPDLIHLPTAAEAAVYMGGFLAVLVLPVLLFSLTGQSESEEESKSSSDSR